MTTIETGKFIALFVDAEAYTNACPPSMFEFVCVNDTPQAIAFLEKQIPHLVIINAMVLTDERLNFCQHVLQMGAPGTILPIIALVNPQDVERAINVGVQEPLESPVHAYLLKNRVMFAGFVLNMQREGRMQRVLADALIETTAALNSTLEFEKLFPIILQSVSRVVPCDAANLMLVEGTNMRIIGAMGYNPMRDIHRGEELIPMEARPLWMRIVQDKKAYVIADVSKSSEWLDIPGERWIRSHLAVPMVIENDILGLLNADSGITDRFDESSAARLQAFADQAALAIRNARLYEQTKQQARELERRVRERTNELEFERSQLRAILDTMVEGVMFFIFDDRQRAQIRYTNTALTHLMGYTAAQFQELPVFELFGVNGQTRDEFRVEIDRYFESFSRDNVVRLERTLRRRDSSEFTGLMTSTRMLNSSGEVMGGVLVIEDISEEKALEDKKKRFVATASHELRTPITNLRTRLHLLRQSPLRWREHAQVLDEIAERMARLVVDLLDVSRFDRGVIRLQLEQVDLRVIAEQVVRLQGAEAEGKKVNLLVDCPTQPVFINGDVERLIQVVTNLTVNAVQYTPSKGTVSIRVRLEGSYAIIQVIDTGTGISPEHLVHIFEPFYRGDSAVEGSGLGLAIAREIITLHGGTLEVESKPGMGSSFTTRLPMLIAT